MELPSGDDPHAEDESLRRLAPRLGRGSEADDPTQEAWLESLLGRGDGVRDRPAWMRALLRSLAPVRRRSEGRRRSQLERGLDRLRESLRGRLDPERGWSIPLLAAAGEAARNPRRPAAARAAPMGLLAPFADGAAGRADELDPTARLPTARGPAAAGESLGARADLQLEKAGRVR